MSAPDARTRFLTLLTSAVHDGTLVKLTLGKHRGADTTLQNLFVRPVTLKAGPHLSLLWRHATRDITKNLPPADALALLEPLLGADFLDAHLLTPAQNAQLETRPDGTARLSVKTASTAPMPVAETHDRAKAHLIPGDAPWLRALGVTNDRGLPREGMAHKFRQIQKFTELLAQLLSESNLLPADSVTQHSTLNSQLMLPLTAASPPIPFPSARHETHPAPSSLSCRRRSPGSPPQTRPR